MLRAALLWVSTVATAIVVLGFVAFTIDQAQEGSETQVLKLEQIDRPNPPEATERAREQEHDFFRELIDDGNDILLSPFTGVTGSHDIWARRGVPTLLGFLFYGFVLRFLANAGLVRRLSTRR